MGQPVEGVVLRCIPGCGGIVEETVGKNGNPPQAVECEEDAGDEQPAEAPACDCDEHEADDGEQRERAAFGEEEMVDLVLLGE
ncbi:hypothetical protein HMPREF0307_02128 [Corynebacterium sp. DNF00584]|nr:hypothetical protein HMPREF0307_02128 [Corynebacterium sp. DNF00584]